MKGKVLVLGAGVAGMTATLDLANAGCEVYLVEKEKEIGGKACKFTCKAAPECQKCSACRAFQLRYQVEHHANVRLLPFSMVTGLSGRPKHFKATVRLLNETRLDLGAEATLDVQAVLIATGFSPYQPNKGEYGYGLYENVMTAYELEHILAQLPNSTRKPQHIAFLQCFGSRNVGTERSYCSRVCCGATGRVAKKLQHILPEARIKVFYQDRQSVGKGPSWFWTDMSQTGIEYIRGLPSQVLGQPNGKVALRFTDTLQGTIHEEEFDWLILASAMIPPQDGLDDIIGLEVERDSAGFYVRTSSVAPTGIFVAGACAGPKDISESIEQAKAAAGQLLLYLYTYPG